jgi:predicted transposase/invertase (TIGR01784 family)
LLSSYTALKIQNIVSTLFLAEAHSELLSLFDREADRQAVSLFLNWFRQLAVHGRIEADDYEALSEVYHHKEEVQTMLIKALEREKRQIFEEGEQIGMEKGRMDQARRTALALLARGMTVSEIAEITGLSEEQVRTLAQRT